VLGEGSYYVDKRQRSIYDHLHWHAREHTAMSRMMVKFREQQAASKASKAKAKAEAQEEGAGEAPCRAKL
jgi:hypothetical protein